MEYKDCSLIVDNEPEIRRQRLREDSCAPQLIKTVHGEGDVLATSAKARQQCV